MPTLSELEEWIEEQIPRNLHDLPSKLHETLSIYYESLYHELTRYGSPLPSISLPDLSSLGLPTLSQIEQTLPFNTNCTSSSSIQAPPPPVGFIQKTSNHLSNHSGKYLTTSLTIGLGLTLWYAYGRGFNNGRSLKGKGRESNVAPLNGYWFDWKGLNRKRKARVERGLRREAVVVLGADTPLGRSLALSLSSSSNLIVLCTISTPTSFNSFEALIPPSSRGYVKALLLDSSDPVSSIPTFIRDVKAALGLRWPSTIAGDPYARKGEEISLIGVVNCLSYLPEIEANHSLGIEEDEDLELNPTDLTQLLDSHVTTPLSVISSLLPFLKTPTSSYLKSLNLNNNYVGGNNNNRVEFELSPTSTILNILPLLNLKVSLPGKMRENIIAKSIQSGMEVLKRENEAVESNQLYRDAEDDDDDDDDLVRFGRRNVRFTTLTLSSGNAFSFGLGNDSPSIQKQNPNVSNSNSSINSDPTTSSSSNFNTSRPALNQSRSSLNLSSTWSSRDSHTQSLMEKVSSILLKRSCYKLPILQNLHLGFEKSLIHGRTSISNSNLGRKKEKEIFTQAQEITQTSHASNNTFIKKSLSKLNSRLAIFKAYSYSIFGSLRNSTLHYLSAFSHFLIQDLSEDVLDFIITLSLRKNKRRIREKENDNVTSSSSSTGYRYNHHRRSTIKQGQSQSHSQSQLTTPSTGNSGLGSSPLHSAPRTDSNPTSSTKSGTSSIASEEAEAEMSGPGSSGSEAEVEDGYDIHSLPDSNNGSGNSQMTNSVEFDSNQRSSQILTSSGENSSNSDSAAQGQENASSSSGAREREDLNGSQQFESSSVMGESWVRLSESENGREE